MGKHIALAATILGLAGGVLLVSRLRAGSSFPEPPGASVAQDPPRTNEAAAAGLLPRGKAARTALEAQATGPISPPASPRPVAGSAETEVVMPLLPSPLPPRPPEEVERDPIRLRSWLLQLPEPEWAALRSSPALDGHVRRVVFGLVASGPEGGEDATRFLAAVNERIPTR